MFNNRSENNSLMYKLFLFLLFFATYFLLKFKIIGFLSPLRLSLFLSTILFFPQILTHFKEQIKKHFVFYLALANIIIYTIVQTLLLETDFGMLSRTTVFVVFTLYLSVSFHFMFRDLQQFFKIVTYCCLLQSIMVYISFFYPPYRMWLDTVMVNGGNIPFAYGARVPGFSTGAGATLSIALALGCFCSMCNFYFEKTSKKYIYLMISFFIFSSCIVVGKTGLILCGYFILSIILVSLSYRAISIFIFSTTSVLAITFLFDGFSFELLTLVLPDDQKQLVTAIYRSFGFLFGRDDTTVSALQNMPLPPLDIVSMIGTGSINDQEGISLTGNDIGYVQTYYGYGIIMAVVFYLSILMYCLSMLWEIKNTPYIKIALILFIPLFALELKEPFISKITYPFVFFLFINLVLKSKKKSRPETAQSVLHI